MGGSAAHDPPSVSRPILEAIRREAEAETEGKDGGGEAAQPSVNGGDAVSPSVIGGEEASQSGSAVLASPSVSAASASPARRASLSDQIHDILKRGEERTPPRRGSWGGERGQKKTPPRVVGGGGGAQGKNGGESGGNKMSSSERLKQLLESVERPRAGQSGARLAALMDEEEPDSGVREGEGEGDGEGEGPEGVLRTHTRRAG
jgi:hypothetical protein